MPASQSKTKAVTKPTFVFKGTIKKLKSATMKDVPVNDRTAVVTVDQIVEAPPGLADYNGQDITVQLSGRAKVSVGQEMIFHTTSWMYGDSIAVQALSQEPVKSSHAAMLAAGADPAERHAQRRTRERFDHADLVVSGKVVAVRLPAETTRAARGASAAPSDQMPGGPVSEHDPKWREAVIEVADVHKGGHPGKQVVVRFPASTDVMWYGAPKFHPGQQGYFMLHKSEDTPKRGQTKKRSKRTIASAAGAEDATAKDYAALDPIDFQPYQEPGGIKTIIESETMKKQ
ncbi:MAG TPA: hypothetical protein VGL29_08500 [Blastocatellia bacterium]|jgi:hypothetical protein